MTKKAKEEILTMIQNLRNTNQRILELQYESKFSKNQKSILIDTTTDVIHSYLRLQNVLNTK